MPQIPQSREFKRSTSPLSILVGYGSSLAVLLAALDAYWENRAGGQKVEEVLLYNLWKECRKWLKKKEQKPVERQNSELFMRRKLNVELLRDASMEKLAQVSPAVSEALGMYQARKLNQGPLNMVLQPLSQGYNREREFYLRNNKQGGASISWSYTQQYLDDRRGERNMKKFRNKQHGDLTLDEAAMLSRMFPHEPVVFRNKIERMRNLVTVNEGGLLGNLEGTLLLMNEPTFNMYAASLYAMDKYGNLFVDQLGGQRDYVANSSRRVFELKQTSTINHSSFMAGADVLCAGCIHIGYDTRAARLEAGVLSFIDNNSGHYKPTAQNLQNCVIALRDQGVHMDDVMVCDRSQGKSRALSYWAPDFIAGMRNPWPQPDEPPMGSPLPPPIRM